MDDFSFFNRDLSWLSFNERVLSEAGREGLPLLEQIKFLSIYSSNLDEFYRVRMPVLRAILNDQALDPENHIYRQARQVINKQQQKYGAVVKELIIPGLLKHQVDWIYHQNIPESLSEQVKEVFRLQIQPLLCVVGISPDSPEFFAENNRLYQAVILTDSQGLESLMFINIPSESFPRLFKLKVNEKSYVIFLEDIIRHNLNVLFPEQIITGAYNIKVTRDADMEIEDEVDENIIAAMEKELAKRDYGPATRFLCQPDIPLRQLYEIIYVLNLQQASIVEGGYYHNLKDLSHFPLEDGRLQYPRWPATSALPQPEKSIFRQIREKDILIHVPYQSFDPVIDFFNEAARNLLVTQVFCTLYRVADPSLIVKALIQAAENGKKVTVMLELKARFDEANNIKWASLLKAAGVKLIYSSSAFKVHAKVALVKTLEHDETGYLGLLSTGNLNESTAKFYTDHILLTANEELLKELELLFQILGRKKQKISTSDKIFNKLLVAQFNLQSTFLDLIEREIRFARQGLPALITIKVNNLEEKILISKLYEASNAGVEIRLIIRSICCLVPGIKGQSERITVKRIVDRYLEHGRVFCFNNNGNTAIYMGSADWMNRNIYSRIEVCFPLLDPALKQSMQHIIDLQWADTVQAVEIDSNLDNVPIVALSPERSQQEIYQYLQQLKEEGNYEKIL